MSNFVSVIFSTEGRRYDYAIPENDEPEIGDFVLTAREGKAELGFIGLAEVVEIKKESRFANRPYLKLIPYAELEKVS